MSDDPRHVFVRELGALLRARLETEDGAPLTIVKRPVDGPQTDIDLGCVWWEGVRPHPRGGIVSEDYYRVRLFRRWRHDDAGVDQLERVHEHLMLVAGELEDVLKPYSQRTAGHDYFNVTELAPDYVMQCVNAQITAFDRNRSAAGG